MEIYTTVCYWVNDRSRAGGLVFNGWPNATTFMWGTGNKSKVLLLGVRLQGGCSMLLISGSKPGSFLLVSSLIIMQGKKYSRGTWTLCMHVLQAGCRIFHGRRTSERLLMLLLIRFIRFLRKAPPLIPDIKPVCLHLIMFLLSKSFQHCCLYECLYRQHGNELE